MTIDLHLPYASIRKGWTRKEFDEKKRVTNLDLRSSQNKTPPLGAERRGLVFRGMVQRLSETEPG